MNKQVNYTYQLNYNDKNRKIQKNLKNYLSNNPHKSTKNIISKHCNSSYNLLKSRNLIKSRSFQALKIIKDFKNTLKETQLLKNKILKNNANNSKNYNDQNRTNKINEKASNKTNNKFKDSISAINKDNNSDDSYDVDDSFNFKELMNKDIKFKNFNSSPKNDLFNKSNLLIQNKKEMLKNQKEKIKTLKKENKELINSNDAICKQNHSLEMKISDYKNKEQIYNIKIRNKILNNFYDENLNKFINGVKSSLQRNINENTNLTNKIINLLKNIQMINSKFNSYINNYKNLYRKIIDQSRDVEMIDNTYQKLNDLKETQNNLNNDLAKLKTNLNALKTKEKILSTKYESNLKSKQDNEEIVLKLRNTINELNKKDPESDYSSYNNNIDLNNNLPFDLLGIKIKQLNSIIKCLQNQKHMLKEENYKLKNGSNKSSEVRNIGLNEGFNKDELEIELDNLRKINFNIKNNLGKRENQIKLLKDLINKLSIELKENKNNINRNSLKKEIQLLIKEDPEDILFNNYLKEKELDDQIKKAGDINSTKIKELDELTRKYEDIIYNKEQIILFMENKLNKRTGILKTIEDKVKPLYKKNIIPKTKSFSFIKKDNANKNIFINESNKIIPKNNDNYFVKKIKVNRQLEKNSNYYTTNNNKTNSKIKIKK